MRRILLGPYRSGKSDELVSELLAYKAEQPLGSCIILTPSARSGRLIKEKLLKAAASSPEAPRFRLPTAGFFNLTISTIYQACQQVLHKAGKAKPVLPREVCAAVVAKALHQLQVEKSLRFIGSIAEFSGTNNALLSLFDEFERAALTPEELLNRLEETASADSRFIELACIYKRYWNILQELNCVDQKQQVFEATKSLQSADAFDFKLDWLLVDGFDRISPLQAMAVRAISDRAKNTLITFDWVAPLGIEAHDDQYSWKENSFDQLLKYFPDEMSRALQMPFPAISVRKPQITLSHTLDRFAEMKEIARQCKEAICLRNVSASEILVTCRDLRRYLSAVRSAFNEAGLKYVLDESIEVSSLPLVQLIRRLLHLPMRDYPRSDVIACLRSPNLNLATFGISNDEVSALDEATRENNLSGGWSHWKTFLSRWRPESSARLLKFFERLFPPIKAKTAEDWCRWIEDLEADLIILRAKNPLSERALSEREGVAALRHSLRTILMEESILGARELSFDAFVATLDSLMEPATRAQKFAHSNDAIVISSAEQAPNRRYDEIYVAGFVEGEFPRRGGRAGFVSADELARWRSFAVNLWDERQDPGYEKALVVSLLERARKRLSLSVPQFEMNGDELLQSFFLSDGTLPGEISARRVPPYEMSLHRPVAARDLVGAYLWHVPGLDLPEDLENHDEIKHFWQSISTPIFGSYIRFQNERRNAHNGYLSDIVSAGYLEMQPPEVWSATSINNYRQCPFRFWMTNLLRLEPRFEPESGLDVQAKGQLFHKIMEVYHTKLSQVHPERRADERERVLGEAFAEAVQEFENREDFFEGRYWKNEKQEILFRIRRFIEKDNLRLESDRRQPEPALFEAAFGIDRKVGSFPALVLDTPAGRAVIRGIIDRIDLWTEQKSDGEEQLFASIVDYKTGSTSIPPSEALKGTNLQLPLYAAAVQQSILPHAQVVNGAYLSINAGRSIGSLDFASDGMRQLPEMTAHYVGEVIKGVCEGNFAVAPISQQSCKNCDHKTVCRITELKLFQNEDDD